MSGACPQIVLSLENQKNPMQWNDNFFRNRTCDEHVKLCWGAAAMRCELRPTLDTIGKHASFISNDESHFVTFYSYFGSHILWLFTAILEVTNCVCSGYGGGYWIWKHKICLDTGGNIGGWKSQIVTFYSYTQNLSGYWGGYRRVEVTNCDFLQLFWILGGI